jgi:oxygen-independent coproporphyrinogen-3 oxidase
MKGNESWGVYVHLPWCRVRCPYCAFTVVPTGGKKVPDPGGYTDALLRQWDVLGDYYPGSPATLAFGGGTPSLHPPHELRRLIEQLAPVPGASISLEANPEDVDDGWLEAMLEAGVDRLSLGVQTLQPRPARLLARAHGIDSLDPVISAVASAGFSSWSIDLIFAVPGQTAAEFDRDLDAVARWDIPHVSLYGLAAEPGTPYTQALQDGKLRAPSDDSWRRAYDHARGRLATMGLHQYEISNYARTGHRSSHNEHYWHLRPWAGLGLAAHGRLPDGTRTISTESLAHFQAAPTRFREWRLAPLRERAEELIIACLRHVDGLSLERLDSLGFSLPNRVLSPMLQEGLATLCHNRLALTGTGFPIADALVAHLAVHLESHTGAGSRRGPA